MKRRPIALWPLVCVLSGVFSFQGQALALSLADLSNAQASEGLKAALEKGARSAVAELG